MKYEDTAHLRTPLIEGPMSWKDFSFRFGFVGMTHCTESQFYKARKENNGNVPVSLMQAEMDYWPRYIEQIKVREKLSLDK